MVEWNGMMGLNEAIKWFFIAKMKSAKPSKHLECEQPRWNQANPRKHGPLQIVGTMMDKLCWTRCLLFSHAPSTASSWNLLDRGTSHGLSLLGVSGPLLLSCLIDKASKPSFNSHNMAHKAKIYKNSQNKWNQAQ